MAILVTMSLCNAIRKCAMNMTITTNDISNHSLYTAIHLGGLLIKHALNPTS